MPRQWDRTAHDLLRVRLEITPHVRLLVGMPSTEEPVRQVLQPVKAVLVILRWLRLREVRVRRPVSHGMRDVPEALSQPARQIVATFVLLTERAHRLLQTAERSPIPNKIAPQLKQETPLHGVELSPQNCQSVVHT